MGWLAERMVEWLMQDEQPVVATIGSGLSNDKPLSPGVTPGRRRQILDRIEKEREEKFLAGQREHGKWDADCPNDMSREAWLEGLDWLNYSGMSKIQIAAGTRFKSCPPATMIRLLELRIRIEDLVREALLLEAMLQEELGKSDG